MITEILDPYSEKHAREKKIEFDRMAADNVVTLQIDARRLGVQVPEHLGNTPNLLLKFSPRYASTLHVTTEGVRQELSFRGEWILCVVPWLAVYAIYPDKHGAECAIWANDVPSELRRAFGMDPKAVN